LLKKWNWRINNESIRTKLRFNQSSKSINRGQEKYQEIALLGKIDDAGGSNRSQQWWGYADLVEETLQKVRTHREEFIKRYPQEAKTIRQIGKDVDALAQSSNKVIRIGDYSKEAN